MNDESDSGFRNTLSRFMSIGGLAVIFALGVCVICVDGTHAANVQTVFNALVPLVASWVGTVLAYYYSKENLAAATSSVATLAKGMVDMQRLRTTSVKDKMLPRSRIITLPGAMTNPAAALDTVLLMDIVAYANAHSIARIPIFTDADAIRYIVHLSVISQYIADQAILGTDTKTLTFKGLTSAPGVGALIQNSFGIVSAAATLDQVKTKMDATASCEDVFITDDGTPGKPVIGWLTDNDLLDAARV